MTTNTHLREEKEWLKELVLSECEGPCVAERAKKQRILGTLTGAMDRKLVGRTDGTAKQI